MNVTEESKKEICWSAALIRRFRAKRTQKKFGELVGVALNTVWRWEDGSVEPGPEQRRRLSEMAERERFLQDWKLAGSGVLVGNVDEALGRLRTERRHLSEKRSRKLRE